MGEGDEDEDEDEGRREVRVINISGELERQSGYLLANTGCTVTNEYLLGRSLSSFRVICSYRLI
jgi:hypothetical protein